MLSKQNMTLLAVVGGAYIAYRWWQSSQPATPAGPLQIAGPVSPVIEHDGVPSTTSDPYKLSAPSGPEGVGSATVTPRYLGYGSTY